MFDFFAKSKKKETSPTEFHKNFLAQPLIENNETQSGNESTALIENIICAEDESKNTELKTENEELKSKNALLQLKCAKLKSENQKYLRDLKSMKKLLNETCVLQASKELKLRILEKKNAEGKRMFDDHVESLGENALSKLRRVPVSRRSDSIFVLRIMQNLYSNKTQDLEMKTACGRSQNGFISPKNKSIVEDLLTERLLNLNLSEKDFTERLTRVNKLINNAINNILRQKVSSANK